MENIRFQIEVYNALSEAKFKINTNQGICENFRKYLVGGYRIEHRFVLESLFESWPDAHFYDNEPDHLYPVGGVSEFKDAKANGTLWHNQKRQQLLDFCILRLRKIIGIRYILNCLQDLQETPIHQRPQDGVCVIVLNKLRKDLNDIYYDSNARTILKNGIEEWLVTRTNIREINEDILRYPINGSRFEYQKEIRRQEIWSNPKRKSLLNHLIKYFRVELRNTNKCYDEELLKRLLFNYLFDLKHDRTYRYNYGICIHIRKRFSHAFAIKFVDRITRALLESWTNHESRKKFIYLDGYDKYIDEIENGTIWSNPSRLALLDYMIKELERDLNGK